MVIDVITELNIFVFLRFLSDSNEFLFGFCNVTMMLLRSQSISYFNVKRTIWLKEKGIFRRIFCIVFRKFFHTSYDKISINHRFIFKGH